MNSRKAVFMALDKFFKDGFFLDDSFASFEKTLKQDDVSFVKRLGLGCIKNYLTLRTYFKNYCPKGAKLKRSEVLCAVIGLYQKLFMESVPDYAAISETLTLAKQVTHSSFPKRLSAILRKCNQVDFEEFLKKQPIYVQKNVQQELYEKLLDEYGELTTEEILDAYHSDKQTYFWQIEALNQPIEGAELEDGFYKLLDSSYMTTLQERKDIYFQNKTPCHLFEFLKTSTPKNILDLCAAPGGKLVLSNKHFPKATLHAVEVSEKRAKRLYENIEKFHLEAEVTSQDALDFSSNERFDLVILDAPCSNSGVFRKKPEGLITFSANNLKKLVSLQKKLLEKAKELTAIGGEIWYLTCSILQEENEEILQFAKDKLGLKAIKSKKILPNQDGFDGGFGAVLIKESTL